MAHGAVGGKEGDRHAGGARIAVGALEVLAKGDVMVVAIDTEIEREVDKAGGEDMEVEEVGEVEAAVETEAVAETGGIDIAEGARREEAVHAGGEKAVAHQTAEGMPYESALFVGGGAIGNAFGHAGEGTVAIVGEMGIEQDINEVFLIVVVGPGLAVGSGHLLAERGTALVNPHVADGGASDEVAKPGMTEFVAHGHLAGRVGAGGTLGHETYV